MLVPFGKTPEDILHDIRLLLNESAFVFGRSATFWPLRVLGIASPRRRWHRSSSTRERSSSRSRRARGRAEGPARISRSCPPRSTCSSELRDILVLRNLDDVPQIFGPTLIMPGQNFRLPFESASEYQFACTAHVSGEMSIVVEDAPKSPCCTPALACAAGRKSRFEALDRKSRHEEHQECCPAAVPDHAPARFAGGWRLPRQRARSFPHRGKSSPERAS